MARTARRRRVRRPGWALGIVVGGAAILLMLVLTVSAATMGDAERGKAHAQAVCAECHAVAPGARKAGYAKATAFQVLAERPDITELSLRAFLRSPHENMPELVLTEGEIDDIAAYILSLR